MEDIALSLFIVVETWIEVLGMPLWPICVLFIVVPLYVWSDGVFKLLEGCMAHTARVDLKTYMARVKVLKGEIQETLKEILLWLDDLRDWSGWRKKMVEISWAELFSLVCRCRRELAELH